MKHEYIMQKTGFVLDYIAELGRFAVQGCGLEAAVQILQNRGEFLASGSDLSR